MLFPGSYLASRFSLILEFRHGIRNSFMLLFPSAVQFVRRSVAGRRAGWRAAIFACHSSHVIPRRRYQSVVHGTNGLHFYHGTERDTAVSPPAIRSFVPSFCSRPVSFCRSQIGSKKFDTLVLDFLNLAGVKSAGRSLDRFHAHAK